MIRTYHRSLSCCEGVWTYQDGSKTIWVIAPGIVHIPDTHAGGREIHFLPGSVNPRTTHEATIGPVQDDPVQNINPRQLLSPGSISELQAMFPLSVGARVLISGFVTILFQNRDDITKSWKLDGRVATFGNLRLVYDVMANQPSNDRINSGKSISQNPNDSQASASLGLKLRLPNGQVAITVPTHAFVKLRDPSRPLFRVLDWVTSLKSRLSKFHPVRRIAYEPAVAISKNSRGNSPIGKTVYLAGQARAVSNFSDSQPVS